MNRYPAWKYVLIVLALAFGILYTVPNFYSPSPALQVNSAKATVKVDSTMQARVEDALKAANLANTGIFFNVNGTQGVVRARFVDPDAQFKAKEALEKALNPDQTDPAYSVTFNSMSSAPSWLQSIHALPMFLGLDLRGGVHFLMQVDTNGVLTKRLQGMQASIRSSLRDKDIRHSGIERNAEQIIIKFTDADTRTKAKNLILDQQRDADVIESGAGTDLTLTVSLKPLALQQAKADGVKQNIATLAKRINELGTQEPIIQQQGIDRIVVELPGVVDVARAKDIIGRTATLEVRMRDETILEGTDGTATVPYGSELFKAGKNVPVILLKDPVLTGESISGASASFDQHQQPAVSIDLNGDGGRKMREATRGKIGKRMAIVLFEKGKGEVLTVPTIQAELGSSFQITGMGSTEAASDLALLLRAGALAAPMAIIEESVIGPQLGADNIKQGFDSTLYGFIAISIFMICYYMLFGGFSVLALSFNLLLLVAILSLMQIALTLPGMAAIALALGMAIDSNVLINERIREELRAGNSPQAAISAGFDRAWATILDSNVTTLIVGLALLAFGSGSIRGFAVVHCLGILTSMFSSVFVSRGVVNLWYGRKRKLTKLSIGQIWKPAD
ncbi:protein translocase subunit SecD [Solimicrobium silvestre]|uniref:Protein translocase subunit SecD n=1 Tax=Solimicrobium silvestre TaxID=2099400 RepID=A0A2S9H0Y5_9BURK|nr:protein translocase subunit SecD [Solimicrobium silvestre]PRC93641.1 secD: protein-export membrane protein SecD [Solimicrobium silvestre]